MILNMDCLREVLIQTERLSTVAIRGNGLITLEPFSIAGLYKVLPSFSHEDIYYSVLMLTEAGLLLSEEIRVMGGVSDCSILRLTYQGHEFLAKIKDPGHWSAVRRILPAVCDYSLSAISAVAEGITKAALDKRLFI